MEPEALLFVDSRLAVLALLLEFGEDLLEVLPRLGVLRAALGTALALLLLLDPLLQQLLVAVRQVLLSDALRLLLALQVQD